MKYLVSVENYTTAYVSVDAESASEARKKVEPYAMTALDMCSDQHVELNAFRLEDQDHDADDGVFKLEELKKCHAK